jgi:hypothetical protein
VKLLPGNFLCQFRKLYSNVSKLLLCNDYLLGGPSCLLSGPSCEL